jgi:hypothetical protein
MRGLFNRAVSTDWHKQPTFVIAAACDCIETKLSMLRDLRTSEMQI